MNYAKIDAAIPKSDKDAIEKITGASWLGMEAIQRAIAQAQSDYPELLEESGVVGIEANFAKIAEKYGEAPQAATGAAGKSSLEILQARLRVRERQLKADPESKIAQAQVRILKRAIQAAQ